MYDNERVDVSCAQELDGNRLDSAVFEKASRTQFPSPIASNPFSNEEKIALIAKHFHEIMVALGLDMGDESLKETPLRVAKMYVEELFTGLDESTFPAVGLFDDISQVNLEDNKRSNPIFININFLSFCEHHFVPIEGRACVAYIPNGKLIGLSKIPEVVRFFSRRPQVQERLAAQIVDAISTLLGSEHVAARLSATHHCMTIRGIESTDSLVTTHVLKGDFEKDPSLRQEFFQTAMRH